ncbi:MAG: MmgE/PrpD family protein [Rhodospirillales bacterium]|jgi:2-methylcitrate dehydratase PrpD
MTIAQDLASRVSAMKYEDFPDEAVRWAKIAIADTIGVGLAGAVEDTVKIPERVLGVAQSAGQIAGISLVWGRSYRTRALDAALINGTAAHAFDFDDCSNSLGGHPSAPIVPVALAIGEEIGSTGREYVEAYIAGFEAENRIARGVHMHHYKKGWHPTATLGIFGAIAACGRLLKLDDATLATAFAIGVSEAAGVKANFGTMTKPLHVGLTGRNGLFACLMAKEGFTASMEAFEHKQGYLEVFNGAGTYDVSKILDGWCAPLDLIEPGVMIKQYPCCGSTHMAIDAAIALHDKHKLTVEQIEKIEVITHENRLEHTNKPDPLGELAAKFSVQYVVCRGLIDGKVVLGNFENEAYMDKGMRALLPKVSATSHADDDYTGTVTVTLKDGTQLTETAWVPFGRGPKNPMSADELKAKFVDCALRALPAEAVERLHAALWDLENLKSVRDITDIMALPAGAAQAAE